jgi:hypothetical protein
MVIGATELRRLGMVKSPVLLRRHARAVRREHQDALLTTLVAQCRNGTPVRSASISA